MKARIKQSLILVRNRWGAGNSIRKSRDSTVDIDGNLRRTTIRIDGKSTIVIPRGARTNNATILIRGNNNRLELAEGVLLSGKVELFGDGNELIIGRDTKVAGTEFTVHNGTKVTVGPRCIFSTHTDVRTTDSHRIFNAERVRINNDADIHIGSHVWVCRMVTILKGSRIGDGSVIGGMSLVSGKIPGRVIAAGVPAKPIRDNISWEK